VFILYWINIDSRFLLHMFKRLLDPCFKLVYVYISFYFFIKILRTFLQVVQFLL